MRGGGDLGLSLHGRAGGGGETYRQQAVINDGLLTFAQEAGLINVYEVARGQP